MKLNFSLPTARTDFRGCAASAALQQHMPVPNYDDSRFCELNLGPISVGGPVRGQFAYIRSWYGQGRNNKSQL